MSRDKGRSLLEINTELLGQLKKANDAYEADPNSPVLATLNEIKATLANQRGPSKAGQLGDHGPEQDSGFSSGIGKAKVHRYVKATYQAADSKPKPGELITAIALSRSPDMDDQARGKAMLRNLHVQYAEGVRPGDMGGYQIGGNLGGRFDTFGKATLGTTGATGGYVLPNNLVAPVVKPAVASAQYTQGDDPLCTVINGVAVRGVDMPYRTAAPTRMTFGDWGNTKENRNEAYGSYTATLGTLALIYDVSNQYLRFSAGAAEADVLDELGKAFRLACNYAVLAGPGTGTVGSGDPTCGVYTSLIASDPSFTTTFGSASTSTLAGNAAVGIAQGLSALAGRSRVASAVVMDYQTYFTLWESGSDQAGFFASGAAMSGARALSVQNGQLYVWGCPVFYDPQFNSYTGSSKHCIVGDWKALRVFMGSEFRIDSSNIAGTRWDQNLTGYRGEAEIAVHAGAAVATGAFQLVKAIVP